MPKRAIEAGCVDIVVPPAELPERILSSSGKQIATDDGRWCTVRIMPYRRLDNVIEGVVITLVDITAAKRLESTLRQTSNP